ncbi:MAG TPA: MG2 domain-containing protein, partial [Candidatus Baltobacteraceae bacterium]|nr:MG2 domain-containing protein [Candidatus Baltobacteraceae bacterium]
MKSTQAGRFLTIAAASAALLFGTAQAQRQLARDVADPLAVEPSHTIQIPLNFYEFGYQGPSGSASTEFYRIPRDLFIGLAARTIKTPDAFQAVRTRGTLVRSFVSNESDAESGARVADVGEYPVGQYAAVVTNGSHVLLTPVTVTTIGVLAGSTGTTSAFWAVNLADFSAHRERLQFLAFSNAKEHDISSTADGVAVTDLKAPWSGGNSAILAEASDGSIGVMTRYWYGQERGETAFVQTDRPLYREGQRVHFRAIYRTGDIGSFEPPHGQRRIRVLDEDNTKIYDRTLTLDRYGSVHGDFVLSDSARLGAYRILVDRNDWGPYGFQVQAYKKPEYEADLSAPQRTIIGGHTATFSLLAKYFFGRPAAGMHVAYTAVAQPQYYWFSPFDRWFPHNYQTKTLAQGSAVTDGNGAWKIRVPTNHVTDSQTLEVTADLRDTSGRTVSTASSMQIVPAEFSIGITQDRWFAQAGHPISFGFTAHSYETQKSETRNIHVTVTHAVWNQKAWRYDSGRTDLTRDITTGDKTAVAFTPEESGMYAVRATGTDEAGNTSAATSSLWVSDARGGEPLPGMQQPLVTFSKTSYKPGERMQALITLPVRDRDVLAVLSTDRVAEARVIHVRGYSAAAVFAEPQDAQHVTLSVSLPQELGVMNGAANVSIVPGPRVLNVAIVPDRAKYEPGQRAQFRVHVTDAKGRPVRTEIGISVVDAALLALLPDSSNIGDTFYGATSPFYPEAGWYRPNRTLKTIAAIRSRDLVKPGTTSDTYSVQAPRMSGEAATPAPQGMNGPVRSKFADTAYWAGDAQTDDYGNGRIVFTWPDNLTTWVAKAVAVDDAASVGQGNGKALVTKDFLVRLELPRFLRKGDKTTIGGIAHGVAGSAQAHLRLDINADPLDALVAFDHTASASTSWPYTAPAIGDQTFVLRGSDGARSDAMQMMIPIESSGTAEHERDAGTTQAQSTLAVSLPAGYDAGALHLQLTPSVAAQLVENVRLLDVYPYYCTEQTMSAALPAVFVDRVLKRTHLQRTADRNTAEIVEHALARLAQLQHGDGSWGWWENDDGHPFMTAYALYGLTEFRKAGYDVSRNGMYSRGIDALVALLETQRTDTLRFWGGAQKGSEWNTRAYMLFSLANAAPERIPRSLLRQTIDRAKDLNSYALATLGLAAHELGDDTTARRLLALLNARAIDNGTYRYWTGESWHYAWEDDPIETTAYALRLNAALGDAAGTARTVAFLRSEQHGSWWFTTKDTAAAIYAIAQTVPDSSPEFSPDETVRVSVD